MAATPATISEPNRSLDIVSIRIERQMITP